MTYDKGSMINIPKPTLFQIEAKRLTHNLLEFQGKYNFPEIYQTVCDRC